MAITRYEPWGMLNQLYREMDSMFQPPIAPTEDNQKLERADWAPAVDIRERGNEYVLQVDLPGVDPKQVEITAEDGVLEIKGERNSEMKQSQEGFTRVERSFGMFYRRFNLPDGVDADGIRANAEHGVLTVTIPKAEARKPRKIEVS